MTVERVDAPTPEEFVEIVEASVRDGAMLTAQSDCEVEYDGRTSGYLGPGDRVLVAKRDGTVLVHQPDGHEPVNWMPAGGSVSARVSEGDAVVRARRVNPRERVAVRIREAYGVTRFDADDGATYEESGTEAEMHEYVERNPEELEEGLRIVEHERETTYGFVDFYAVDAEGTPVVIEVKRIQATLNHFDQLQRYVRLYEDGDASVTAHSESKNEFDDCGENGELIDADASVRGMLVAPSASERVRRALRDAGLEFVELSEFGLDSAGATETTLGEFL